MTTPSKQAQESFPWYDSGWLHDYIAAVAYIEDKHPARLEGFVDAMTPLRTRPDFRTHLLPNLLDVALQSRIKVALPTLKPADLELHEIKTFGRWVVHDNPILTELQDRMTAVVSEVAGEAVEDAPSAKWTLDICIDQSEPWPIHFSQVQAWPRPGQHTHTDWEQRIRSDPANHFMTHVLEPGQAVVFSGSSQWHYRDPLPADWEHYFDIPGLGQAPPEVRARQKISTPACTWPFDARTGHDKRVSS